MDDHWITAMKDAVICRGKNGSFNLCIEGGSEYGQFVVIGDVVRDKVIFRSGALAADEILLEINGKHVAGYTQTDAISLIKESGEFMQVKAVPPGPGISRDLRKYLAARFPRGSADHELQQTIRDNLYTRTVPCTTRRPRPGEVPGVDYEFLTVNEYLELEKSGRLLESGYYEGNYYGTPKPPKTPMTPGTGTVRRVKNPNKRVPEQEKRPDPGGLGPLPDNWEMAFTKNNEPYFIDHSSGRTQWEDPRKQRTKSESTSRIQRIGSPDVDTEEPLPPGWEKVDDPNYGTYYMDHVNRRTQFERPENPHKRKGSQSTQSSRLDGESRGNNIQNKKANSIDSSKLSGETLRVNLRKSAKGFGFTIVGGESPGEVLQVNNIVRGGAADLDGRLRTGDVITRLNGRNVLSWTHADIIRFLQTTRVGEVIDFDLVRGYNLPFDPQDPGVKKVGSYNLINNAEFQNGIKGSTQSLASNTSGGPQKSARGQAPEDYHMSSHRSDLGGSTLGVEVPDASRPLSYGGQFHSGAPQYLIVPIVRGPNGFGFTIADSPYGQRVKEIIDQPRCRGLMQGDVIIRINEVVVHNLDHAKVVDVLKSCPKNQVTDFQIQRSGILTVVKAMPTPPTKREHALQGGLQGSRPKSMPNFDEDSHPSQAPAVRSSTSMGVIATAGDAATGQSSTFEARYDDMPAENYKTLQKAVQSAPRDTSGQSEGPYTDFVITLQRGEGGFGFRIIGGQEENSQVSVDTIVPNGAAERDGRLRRGDIILAVDGINVVNASHRRVISLMGNSALNGQVTLRMRRKNVAQDVQKEAQANTDASAKAAMLESKVEEDGRSASYTPFRLVNEVGQSIPARERRRSDSESVLAEESKPRDTHPYRQDHASQASNLRSKSETNISSRPKSVPPPVAAKPGAAHDVVLTRLEQEGFGFVIMSSPSSNGSMIGRIIPGSPADRCGELIVEDRLLEVNGQNVANLRHSEIVAMVKSSGLQVRLKVVRGAGGRLSSEAEENQQAVPPPRPAEPAGYSRARSAVEDDRRREELRRYQEGMLEKQKEEMRRLEEARIRQIRDREMSQPARPKSAPLSSLSQYDNSAVDGAAGELRSSGDSERRESPLSRGSVTREDRQFIQESAKRRISPGDTAVITLQKGDRGFGFSIRGGEGMPLFVLRIAENGPAWEDGRLRVGDEILEINQRSAERMSHAEAVNTIRNCGDQASLVIRRPLKPLASDDEKVRNSQPAPNRNFSERAVENSEGLPSGYY